MSAGATKEEMLEAAAVGALARLGSGFVSASIVLDETKK
jgi:alkylhydroperoxidase/carboxymuconolactone decarboxylase family protein YurZ